MIFHCVQVMTVSAESCNPGCVPDSGGWELSGQDVIGFAGGVILAIGLLPQVYHMVHRQSGEDISYQWQWWYILGLSLLSTYAWLLELWPVLIPGVVELILVAMMIVLKWHYARRKDRLERLSKLAEEVTPTDGIVLETDTKAEPAI